MNGKTLVRAMLALLLALAARSAFALCVLTCSCSVSTTGVAFGGYNPLSASAATSSGNVRVTCGGVLGLLVPYDIALSKGANAPGFDPRQMASGSRRLSYNLYTSGSHATIWGDGSGGTQIVSSSILLSVLGNVSQDHPVHGRIPARQAGVAPGTYTDTIQVTLTYY